MSEQVIVGGYDNTLNPATTEYNSLMGGSTWSSATNYRRQILPTAGTFKNLRVKLAGAPGESKKYTFYLTYGDSLSNPSWTDAIPVEISGTDTEGSNTVNIQHLSAGTFVMLKVIPDGGPSAVDAYWSIVFTPDTANETILMGGYSNSLDNTDTEYNALVGAYTWTTSNTTKQTIIPCAGTLKSFYAAVGISPGSGKSYTLSIEGDGSGTLDLVIEDFAASADSGSDTRTVSAGDMVYIQSVPSGTPNENYCWWGLVLSTTDSDIFPIIRPYGGIMSTSETRYGGLCSSDQTFSSTEANEYSLGQSMTLKNMYLELDTGLSSGDYTETIRIAGADSTITATVTDTIASDTTHTEEVNDFEYLTYKHVPNSPNRGSRLYIAVCGYIKGEGVPYTSFKIPIGTQLNWIWNSGQYNVDSGMCSFTGSGDAWQWYVISSSSIHWYPSGSPTGWVWISGNSGL